METDNYRQGHHFSKAYFYIQRGLEFVNDFKYLVAGVLAFYYVLKLNNFVWFFAMLLASIPILIVLGWFKIHKMAKVLDWLGIEYGTYWGRYQFTLQEKIIEELQKLNEPRKSIDKSLYRVKPDKDRVRK